MAIVHAFHAAELAFVVAKNKESTVVTITWQVTICSPIVSVVLLQMASAVVATITTNDVWSLRHFARLMVEQREATT